MIKDIKHTEEGDIDLSTGDIESVESTRQHQKDILLADKGYYKEWPGMGVGAHNFLNDTGPANLLRSIRQEFIKDGMKVKKVSINSTEAYYEEN
ncbi:MAG: hypothetical protein LUF04_14110 [Bacteroides sp.]|nr:hypothetical protein [Bacteroides sp.]